jgi:hypothetical protein
MIIAFYGIAAAMVAGGITAMIRGADYIVLERGWTMVLTGAIIATGGVIVAVLTELASRLRKIEDALKSDHMLYETPDQPQEYVQEQLSPAPPSPASRASAFATAGAAAIAAALQKEQAPDKPEEPVAEPSNNETSGTDQKPEADQPETISLHQIEIVTAEESFPPSYTEEIIDVEVEEISEPQSRKKTQNFILLDESIFTEEAKPEVAEKAEENTDNALVKTEDSVAIGTYQSGGNTYVMFENGAIEATTPTGLYRFASLEELKAFIAAGGEAER